MIKPEIWQARVRLGGVTQDDPPLLAFSQIAARPDGKRKLISQMARVDSKELLVLLKQIPAGDEAEIVVEQYLTFSIVTDVRLVTGAVVGEAIAAA